MSFKLLAIRPLEGTDSSMLKGLKPNCIYRFYNEYDYLYEEEQGNVSYIKFQEQYLNNIKNKKDSHLELRHKAIKAIKYNQELPNNFFGENINVSAMVGENGSGKSSLLELYYLCIAFIENERFYNCNILKLPNIVIDVFFLENKDMIGRLSIDNRKEWDKFSHQYLNTKEYHETYFLNDNVFIPKKEFYQHFKLEKHYNHITNYSLYGLNANKKHWLERIFDLHRDTKHSIIINPNRKNGVINVHKEESLANKRLLTYIYGFGEKKLLDNVYVDRFNVSIDLNNVFKVSEDNLIELYGNNVFVLNKLHYFLLCLTYFNGENINTKLDNNNLDHLKLSLPILIREFVSIVEGKEFNEFAIIDEIASYIIWLLENPDTSIDVNKSNYIYILNFLFCFRESMILIFRNERYAKYKLLFLVDKYDVTVLLTHCKFVSQEKKPVEIQEKHGIRIAITTFYNNLLGKFDGSHNIGYLLTNLYYYYYEATIDKMTDEELYIKFSVTKNGKKYIKKDLLLNSLLSSYNHIFLTNHFKSYLEDLKNDNTIDSAELKQAIHYFYSGILEDSTLEKLKSKENESIINVLLDSKYFINVPKIEDIPVALFTYEIKVVKTNITHNDEFEIKNSFEFNNLSSGEINSINSLLQVFYDVYHYVIKIDDKDSTNVCINLIYDEIEVYLHPEYQRKYLKNILIILEQLCSNPKFNKLNKTCVFNILLSTHSPFILSDIPSQNILKLKEGQPKKGDDINSFGANIHDLLANEFFLEDGFMGEFARDKIEQIIKFLYLKKNIKDLENNMSNDFFSPKMKMTFEQAKKELSLEFEQLEIKYSKKEVEQHIKLVGEPLLAIKMKDMCDKAF